MKLQISMKSIEKTLFALLIFYINFIQYKLFQSSLVIIGIGLLIVYFTGISVLRKNRITITNSLSMLLIYTIYMIIPSLISFNMSILNEYITVLEYSIIMFCLVLFCCEINDVEWLIKFKFFSTLFICISFIISPAVYHDKVHTIQYTLVPSLNPNTFSLDVLIGLWSLLYLNSKKLIGIIITSLGALFFLYCIFLSAARKSLVCAIITIVLWAIWIYIPGRRKKGKKSSGVIRVVIILGLSGIVVFFAVRYLSEAQAFLRFQSFLIGGDGSVEKRIRMYEEGIEVFFKKPIFGYGFGGFSSMFGGYSHATVIEVPVSGGIIGAVLYGLFLFGLTRDVKRYRSQKRLNKEYDNEDSMNLILCIIILILCVCVIHPYLFNSYVIIAIVVAQYLISKGNNIANPQQQ